MQFKEFDWLSAHSICPIIPCPTNMVSKSVNFRGRLYLHFRLVFHDKIKQLVY